MKISIVPYEPVYEEVLLDIERSSPQGNMIQLEMKRDRFDSRSVVFEEHRVFVAIDENRHVLGVSCMAVVPISVNGTMKKMGIGYDLKVAPKYRGQGISKILSKYMVETYLLPAGIHDYGITVKAGNERVFGTAKSIKEDFSSYPFVYLTVPVWKRVGNFPVTPEASKFGVALFTEPAGFPNHAKIFPDGLGLWNTWLGYTIRIVKLHPLAKLGVSVANIFLPRYRRLPGEGDELKFASLFDFSPENFIHINEVLAHLQEMGIQYLSVCCAKGDFMYRLLKPLSINTYNYLLLTNFKTNPEDRIVIDVRCL